MFLCHCLAGAQIITGIVCDEDTRLPISNVSVYLNGTSINTITNISGIFELRTASVINTRLVLQHLSYETAIVDHPFEGISDTLFLKVQVYSLFEVTVSADPFSRKQKKKAFREQFLGMTRAGRSCTIMNEDDIQLTFNMQTRRLRASSEKPIVVVNDYLGYKVSFLLVDFWVQYIINTNLNSDYAQNSFFAIVSSFTDINPDSRRIKQRRDNVYERSSNYFFKSFAGEALRNNNFTLFSKSSPINYSNYFAIKDTVSQKMISILPDTDINTMTSLFSTVSRQLEIKAIISVLYRRNVRSDILFMTDSFWVDRYGNIDKFDEIMFSGHMGDCRIGDMLPLDYE